MSPSDLYDRVLTRELDRGETPESIARRYPDLWASGEAVRAAIAHADLT